MKIIIIDNRKRWYMREEIYESGLSQNEGRKKVNDLNNDNTFFSIYYKLVEDNYKLLRKND